MILSYDQQIAFNFLELNLFVEVVDLESCKNFALLEVNQILSNIFQNQYVEMKEEEEIKFTAQFTIRP